ncbi:MAG: hypothetical protein AAF845_14115 [Bacteroidota bacterium]
MAEPGRVDRTAFSITTMQEADAEDRAFWHAQTPEKRLQTMQLLREINYGDAASTGFQRVLEFAQQSRS